MSTKRFLLWDFLIEKKKDKVTIWERDKEKDEFKGARISNAFVYIFCICWPRWRRFATRPEWNIISWNGAQQIPPPPIQPHPVYQPLETLNPYVPVQESDPTVAVERDFARYRKMTDQQEQGMCHDDHARTNLIINYLPQTMTEKELYSMFVTIGPVESCRVMKDYKVIVTAWK